MKTMIFSVAAACAACVATADEYTNVFTGVSSVSAAGVPAAVGASWTTTSVSLTNDDGAVWFETSGENRLSLNVTSAPADTNTVVRFTLNATFEDTGALMNLSGSGAHTAVAVYTNSFNAWNGSAWVALDEVPEGFNGSVATNLLVEVSYQGTTLPPSHKARFTLGNRVLRTRGGSEWVTLATTANNLSGFACSGAGTLKGVDADVMLGVAELNGYKYGTLTAAVAAAEDAGSGEVDVLRETAEDVSVTKSGVTIADNGKTSGTISADPNVEVTVIPGEIEFATNVLAGASGEYTLSTKVSGGNLTLSLPEGMSNKEVEGFTRDGATIKVKIQTATAVLADAKPDGTKPITNNVAKLRQFLEKNATNEYVAANASAASIRSALQASGSNGLPLYQSYVLGIEPADSVKPVSQPGGGSSSDAIVLSIPAVQAALANRSGDYANIRFKVSGADTNVVSTAANAISVPLKTGTYTVTVSFE